MLLYSDDEINAYSLDLHIITEARHNRDKYVMHLKTTRYHQQL